MYTDDSIDPQDRYEAGFTAGGEAAPDPAPSLVTLVTTATEAFLAQDLAWARVCQPRTLADAVLVAVNAAIAEQGEKDRDRTEQNRAAGTGGQKVPPLRPLAELGHAELAKIVMFRHAIIKIAPSNKNSDPDLNVLAAYDDDPDSEHYGTYRSSMGELRSIVRRYAPNLKTQTFDQIVAALEDQVPVRTRGQNPDLVAVKNGIVDLSRRDGDGVPTFIEFSPEHIFTAKLDVDWNPDAKNVVIHNDEDGTDWDFDSWLAAFFPAENPENEGMTELLWQIISATVRPYVPWGKCAFLYSAKGNNGKGTIVSLLRNIVGVANYASIPLTDFGKDFLLEPLIRASAILVDENDVGSFMEKGANFKAVVTNDVITINRKYKAPIAHQHYGFMIQCLNDEPSIKDKSDSFYRRQLFIKFTKSFTGAERKYIKTDYLTRREVLEYVLKRALMMDFCELSEPAAVRSALADFKIANDPLRAFWEEFKDQFVWDLVPFQFAYAVYRSWFDMNYPSGKPIGAIKFNEALAMIVESDPESGWDCPDRNKRYRPGSLMSAPEPLSVEYDIEAFINDHADKRDLTARATLRPDQIKENYRGIRRKDVPDTLDISSHGQAGVPPVPGAGKEACR